MDKISLNDLFSQPPVERLGVVGSRKWPECSFVEETIAELLQKYPQVNTLVSGGQKQGVDGWVKQLAQTHGLAYEEHLPAHYRAPDDPLYRPYSPSNYHERNLEIVKDSDALAAFRWQGSSGTTSTINFAKRHLDEGYVHVYDWHGKP